MNARTIRRAQERKAAKQARKASRQAPELIAAAPPAPSVASLAVAERSIGSASELEKSTSSLNKTAAGSSGSAVVLSPGNVATYSQLVASFFAKWKPVGDEEHRLVQSLADTEWRLLRIPALESAIYAIGRMEFSSEFAGEPDEAVRHSLIEARVFLTYQRQLNNLSIQENRLRRQREKDHSWLQRLQQERFGRPSQVEEIGFEFSTEPACDSNNKSPVAELAGDCLLTESLREHAARTEQSGLDERQSRFHPVRGLSHGELLQVAEH
jgi:hypothetical protein